MKRFYCTVCQRVKRVRRIPQNVATPNAEKVTDRVGECSYHAHGYVRRVKPAREYTPATPVTVERKARRK